MSSRQMTGGRLGETGMGQLDDASDHMGADDFPEENGATHIGMFLTWTIRKGLFVSSDAPGEAVEAVRQGTLSGRDFLLEYCDGKLLSQFFNQQGAAFATKHYDAYIDDFRRLLSQGLKSEYLVEDNAANYEIMARALEQRWAAFQ
jgi:hypothetical protein